MPTSGNSGCATATCKTAVDFVTIHILPYWEDFPLPASLAAAHVDDIRKKVAAAIPNKEIVIGEVGWPSDGRMREGARPSPSNQARVIEETVALAQRENFRVNVIEAFDQPWKRWLEGATGGYWGIFDRATRGAEIQLRRRRVRSSALAHAGARRNPACRVGFAGAAIAGRGKTAPPLLWLRIAALTFAARRPVRLDHRTSADRQFHRRRLAALARLRGHGRGRADRLRGRLRGGPRRADIRRGVVALGRRRAIDWASRSA